MILSEVLQMKRFSALLLSIVLAFSFIPAASAAKMVQTFSTDYFQIYIPGDWIIDQSGQQDLHGGLDFGFMYAKDETMMIESYMFFYDDWAENSLWKAPPEVSALWAEYIDFLKADFAEEDPRYLGYVYAGKYPAAVFSGTNDYGAFLYGEIMINAYSYGFYFYRLNEDGSINSDLTEDDIELFESILQTFVPSQSHAPASGN